MSTPPEPLDADPQATLLVNRLTDEQRAELAAKDLQAVPLIALAPQASLSLGLGRLLDIEPVSLDHLGTADLLGGAAALHKVRIALLGSDGVFVEHGNPSHPIVRVAVVGADADLRFLALRQTGSVTVLPPEPRPEAVIGLTGVVYPGPSKHPATSGQDERLIYRGEFEVEYDAGLPYVRIYSAIVNPVLVTASAKPGLGTSEYKDVQQDQATGAVTLSGGGDPGVLWSGGGRPQRALQWLKKYEHQYAGKPEVPLLRSFLVPLENYLEVTAATAPEKLSTTYPTLTINVDHRGEPNQMGLRGRHMEQLAAVAKAGSLVTYATDPASVPLRPVAGQIRAAQELYGRLGIDAFQSDVLGKDHDPWFTWTRDAGTWKANFRNSPEELHTMARDLREHYVTWEQAKQPAQERRPHALLDTDVEGWPGMRPPRAPSDMGFEARRKRLNAFLNTAGPAADAVRVIVETVLGTGRDVARDYLASQPAQAVDTAALEAVLRNRVLLAAVRSTAFELVRTTSRSGYNITNITADAYLALLENRGPSKKPKNYNTLVFEPVMEKFRTGINEHPDLVLLPAPARQAVADVLGQAVETALVLHTKDLAANPPATWQTRRKTGWLAGLPEQLRLRILNDPAVQGSVATAVAAPAVRTAQIDPAVLGQVIVDRLIPEVENSSATALREKALFVMTDDEVRRAVNDDLLPALVGNYHTTLTTSPPLSLLEGGFRAALADAVATGAQHHAGKAIATLSPPTVSREAIEDFMSHVPQVATQAAIGALIAADYERLKLDPDVWEVDPVQVGADPAARRPFPNDFAGWHARRAEREDAQRAAGRRLTEMTRDPGTPQEIAQRLVDGLLADFPELRAKFAEICAPTERLTFYDHAQLVLGQFLTLAGDEKDTGRFLSRDTVAKAILFHDIEKANSERQFGMQKSEHAPSPEHDREPEHKLAVAMMRRYPALWPSYRDFLAARALVDADPIGLYLRGTHDADKAFGYIVDWAYRLRVAAETVPTTVARQTRTLFERDREAVEIALREAGRRPHADLTKVALKDFEQDVQRFFAEFHQYYQADFSSYTPAASYRPLGSSDLRYAPNKQFAEHFVAEGGTVTDPGVRFELAEGKRHFRYSAAYSDSFAKLAAMFVDANQLIDNYARVRRLESEALVRDLAGPTY